MEGDASAKETRLFLVLVESKGENSMVMWVV